MKRLVLMLSALLILGTPAAAHDLSQWVEESPKFKQRRPSPGKKTLVTLRSETEAWKGRRATHRRRVRNRYRKAVERCGSESHVLGPGRGCASVGASGDPAPVPATSGTPAVSSPGGTALCGASCIQCESGGNAQAVSPSGTYWGLYQFDRQTWAAHGGDPGAYGSAGAAEQHRVAGNISYDAWPNC